MSAEALVVVLVIAARLGLPLLIPLFPLPGILICLIVDGIDQTIFQTYTTLQLDWYQGYDKALDIYYLAIALTAVLRNWTNLTGVATARFLFAWRLAGVVLFEWLHLRWLLLVFTNAFEYFFIAYEVVRTRWDPARWSRRGVILTAAAIWIFIKIPQEYWIHIAQLDVTDTIDAYPTQATVLAVVAVIAAVIAYVVLRKRVPTPAHPFTLRADPLPEPVATQPGRDAFVREHWTTFGAQFFEKALLIGLICGIFAAILPGLRATPGQVIVGVSILIALNAVVGMRTAHRGSGIDQIWIDFGVRVALNVAFVLVIRWLLPGPAVLDTAATLFFLLLLTLFITLYDRYRPIYDYRVLAARSEHSVAGH